MAGSSRDKEWMGNPENRFAGVYLPWNREGLSGKVLEKRGKAELRAKDSGFPRPVANCRPSECRQGSQRLLTSVPRGDG